MEFAQTAQALIRWIYKLFLRDEWNNFDDNSEADDNYQAPNNFQTDNYEAPNIFRNDFSVFHQDI